MGHATEPAHETLPDAWAGIHEQLRNGRDWLDDAYVSTRDFQFRVGRLGELEEKHQTELAPHRMSLVAGAPPGPTSTDPHDGFVGALRPDDLVRTPSPGDLVPYLSVKGDRDVFLDTKAWAGLAGSERPSRAMLASLARNPGEMESLVQQPTHIAKRPQPLGARPTPYRTQVPWSSRLATGAGAGGVSFPQGPRLAHQESAVGSGEDPCPSPNTRRLGVKRKPHPRPEKGPPRLQ